MKLILVLPSLLICCFLTRCYSGNSNHWTTERIERFKTDCSQTDSLTDLLVSFVGFQNNEFDSVTVKEFNGSAVIDSFKIYVYPAVSPDDIKKKRRSAHIQRILRLKSRYQFLIPGEAPFELAEMKMEIWDLESGGETSYECALGAYSINGEQFFDNGNPTFISKGQPGK